MTPPLTLQCASVPNVRLHVARCRRVCDRSPLPLARRMQPVPLAATTRGYPDTGCVVENVHAGSVAVVDLHGRLLWQAGDPHYPTFTRSALKPFQALPFMLDDGAPVIPAKSATWRACAPSSARSDSTKATSNAAAPRRSITKPWASRRPRTGPGRRCTTTVQASTAASWPGAACTARPRKAMSSARTRCSR